MNTRLVEKFQAKGTTGAVYTVHIYQKVIESRPLAGPPKELGGTKSAVLSDGRHLNWVDDGNDTFQILDTDEIIKRI